MTLNFKDLITTVLAALIIGIYYVKTTHGIEIPLISSSFRWAILALGIIGIGMCALSGGSPAAAGGMSIFMIAASIMGIASFILIIYGLVTGEKIAFVLLTGVILLLWAASTIHHFIGR